MPNPNCVPGPVRSGLLAALALAAPGLAQLQWQNPGDWQPQATNPSATTCAFAGIAFDGVRNRVVRFGGQIGATYLDETWELAGTQWLQRTVASRPSGRLHPAMAFDAARQRVVLYGGVTTAGPATDTWEWDGTAWANVTPASGPQLTLGPRLVWHGTLARVLLCGSSGGAVETYQWLPTHGGGMAWTLRAVAAAPPARTAGGLAYDPRRNRVVLFGGQGVTALADTWEYDGTSWTQPALAASPPPRSQHGMAWDPAGLGVVLAGGSDGATSYADTWTYDGTTWTQQAPATGPAIPTGAAMVADTTQVRVVANGLSQTWTWRTPPSPRAGAAMAADPVTGDVLLFGGQAGSTALGDTWIWHNGWQRRSPAVSPPPRSGHAIGYCNGRLYLCGGTDGTNLFNDTWEWNGTSWQASVLTQPWYEARRDAGIASDPNWPGGGRLLFYGGIGPAGVSNLVWQLDAGGWTSLGWGPVACYRPALGFDPDRNVLLLSGGATSALANLGTTFEAYPNGLALLWYQRNPVHAPSPRNGAAIGYDATRRRMVLFGGSTSPLTAAGDTFEWDGSDWTATSPAVSPPPRPQAACAALGEVLMVFGAPAFGPPRGASPARNDTWLYTTPAPGAFDAAGTGCLGLQLSGPPAQLPHIGDAVHAQLTGVPASAPLAFFLLGFVPSATPLDAVGAPGCLLYVANPVVATAVGGGTTYLHLPIPNNPAFVGAPLNVQGMVLEPGANTLGMGFSNRLVALVGWW